MPVALLLLAVSLVLLPVNNLFRCRIEQIRKTYWKSLDDMTGYYMDSLRGLTTLKLFDRDQEHSRILGEKADILNYNINCFMKVNFTSFLVTEAMIYAAILFALVNSAGRIADGSMTIAPGFDCADAFLQLFLCRKGADERFSQRADSDCSSGQGRKRFWILTHPVLMIRPFRQIQETVRGNPHGSCFLWL